MKTTKYKIALASACGAAIGYCFGTTLLSGAWLILAALLGGACGWIIFDPRGFGKAFSQALLEVSSEASLKLQELWAEPWRKILPRAIRFTVDPLLMLQVMGTIMAFIVIPFTKPGNLLTACAACYVITLGLGSFLSIAFFIQEIGDKAARVKVLDPERTCYLFTGKMSAFKFLALTNPIVLPFTALWLLIKAMYHCAKGLIWIVRRIPLITRFCWLVTAKTCVLAHNNGRLASFAGASIGAVIGVIAGHLIIAMAVGAAIGTLAHYVGAIFPNAYINILVQNLETEKTRL